MPPSRLSRATGRSRAALTLLAALILMTTGCSADTFLNQTASLGGETAGSTGSVRVVFINNTDFRAIFTYGTFNNEDQFDVPDVGQFVGNAAGATLEGGSNVGVAPLPCDRVFAIGDPELLRLLEENAPDEVELDEEALVVGTAFSRADLGGENSGLATEGFAPELRARLGVNFSCGSILVIRFEVDDLGVAPFRADFEVIPPREDDRGL